MSHLAHIITVKQALIAEGVTNPLLQTDTCRTAYVRALSTMERTGRVARNDLADFYSSILGYWNETSPIQGNLIMAELRAFNADLQKQLDRMGEHDGIVAKFPRPANLSEDVKVHELDGFNELVETLVAEASKKLADWQEHGRFQGAVNA